MNNQLLEALDEEIARLQQARALLTGHGSYPQRQAFTPAVRTPKRRTLSAKARKAIADAQRRRWAKVKAAKVKSEKKAA